MIDRRLKRLFSHCGTRLRLAESVHWGLWGLAAGLALALALALGARASPLMMRRPLLGAAGLLSLSGATAGAAATWLWPRPPQRLARALDRRLGLAERLTTCWELQAGRLETTGAMAAAQLADTLQAASRIDVRAALPLRAPRRALVAAAVLVAALAASLLLPNPQEQALLRQAAARAAVEEQVEQLEGLREEIAQNEALSEEERQALLQALEEAIGALEEGRATPEEAVAALAEAERALAELQDPGAAGIREALEQAAGEMEDSELTGDIAELLQQGDYAAAAEALEAFAGERGEALTRAQELELAEQLAQAAAALEESNPELAQQLAEAAVAIERGDIEAARAAIRQAAQEMAAAGERVEEQEALEEALSTLQEGRAEVAEAAGSAAGEGSGQDGTQPGGAPGDAGQATGEEQVPAGGHHEDAGSDAPYDELYVPERLKSDGTEIDIGREGDEGLPSDNTTRPLLPGESIVPYSEVYADYASEAAAALEGSYIPLGMKQYVRDYFSSLQP
ncbi:MAG: hypothetical protein JW900_01090 [Anaerolineae bacterium]|nr:hypothetical protein [Anaerolineae bacterium]